jgi:hypothetical protein
MKRGRKAGVRKCKWCDSMHLPGRDECDEFKALPNGCPKCMKADCMTVKFDKRVKAGIACRLTCKHCGTKYYWAERPRAERDYQIKELFK